MRVRVNYGGEIMDLERILGPEAVVAFDRDVPEPGWISDADCWSTCLETKEFPEPHLPIWYDSRKYLQTRHGTEVGMLTDGHGHGYLWVEDGTDPLHGRWEGF